MRYSIFAGFPLAIIAMTAFYELAARLTTDDAAVIGGVIVSILVPISLHRWDGVRLHRLLHPPPHQFPVDTGLALEFLVRTLEQIQFQESDGRACRWRLNLDPEHPCLIAGKLPLRSPLLNPNIVAWLIDIIDKGSRTKVISMRIELEQTGSGTRTKVTYHAPPLLDWSALEVVLQENNRWIHAALLRACTDGGSDRQDQQDRL